MIDHSRLFITVLFYVLTLLIFAVVRTSTVGSGVWFQTVQEQRFGTPTTGGSVAPTTGTAALGQPSMWDEKPNDVRTEGVATPMGGALPLYVPQASPAPSSGVNTYPPSPLSQALSMQIGGANSAGAAGPQLNAVGSTVTGLSAGSAAGAGPAADITQQYNSTTPQQVNMHVSRSSPQQQTMGLQNATGTQGAPVTPSYPQL